MFRQPKGGGLRGGFTPLVAPEVPGIQPRDTQADDPWYQGRCESRIKHLGRIHNCSEVPGILMLKRLGFCIENEEK